MKLGILTSSRADFGIYLPLLKSLQVADGISFEIIAFGTHLSTFHGETISQIISNGFQVKHRIPSMLLSDSAESVSTAMGLTTTKFASFWADYADDFDLVLCLGDRYEMFAAVTAGIPFNIRFVHLHGGETSLGAIDNIFRHAITLASKYHFVATAEHADKVAALTGTAQGIFPVGALSLDNIGSLDLLSLEAFKAKWQMDLSRKTILTTFHPETVNAEQNRFYAQELINVILSNTPYQFLITMPNADTAGNMIRQLFTEQLQSASHVALIENLGSQSYFTAMKYCAFLLGNTSSGIIEAASFGKYVINLGDRQKGRSCGPNVIHVPINVEAINQAIASVAEAEDYSGPNPYFRGNASGEIIKKLKEISAYE